MIGTRTALAALVVIAAAPAHADVTISTAATQNMRCSAGVCEPTATDAVLNVSKLEKMLSSGNVTVTTTGRYEAYNIDVEARFSWSTDNALSLDAADHITIDDEVFSSGSGNLSLSIGSGVPFLIGRHGRVVFQNTSSQLSIDGSEYTLVNSISSLASAIASNPSGNFALSDNYDASADGTYSDSPITTTFTGNFDGLGNTISHLSIHHTGNSTRIALFDFLFTPGTLEHIRLAHVQIKGTNKEQDGDIIGALVGVTTGGYLFQDSATGTIQLSGVGVVGGLVGEEGSSAANIDTCSAEVTIDAVKAKGLSDIGGLVGFGEIILDSFASGSVVAGNNNFAGGLVGRAGGVENSYARGTVAGGVDAKIGGLIGDSRYSIIESVYSTGTVSGAIPSYVGGFAGANNNHELELTKSYWDTDTSGTTQAVGRGRDRGIKGLTTQQLQSHLPNGFDPKVWAESPSINNGLPYLINNPPPN